AALHRRSRCCPTRRSSDLRLLRVGASTDVLGHGTCQRRAARDDGTGGVEGTQRLVEEEPGVTQALFQTEGGKGAGGTRCLGHTGTLASPGGTGTAVTVRPWNNHRSRT